MMYKNTVPQFTERPVVTMGNFDGIHLGHQILLKEVVARAKALKTQSVVITYDHHPLETICQTVFPYLLSSTEEKVKKLQEMGIDHVLIINFNKEVAGMSADEFVGDVIKKYLNPRELVIGYDSHFGKNRTGGFDFLKSREAEYDYKVDLIPPYRINEEIVSSTMIRNLIKAGELKSANELLGHSYTVTGQVIKGMGKGRTFGFPTINLKIENEYKLIPATGVYLTQVVLDSGRYWSLSNIGFSPTVKASGKSEVETFILNFAGDLYDQYVDIIFIEKMREEIHFSSQGELITAMENDLNLAEQMIREHK